jgi:hypothetical protein
VKQQQRQADTPSVWHANRRAAIFVLPPPAMPAIVKSSSRSRLTHAATVGSVAAVLGLVITSPASAQIATPAEGAALHAGAPSIVAARLTGAMRIDGVLSEPAWSQATPITRFTQGDPDEGQPASQPTDVRILHDADALYIGARFTDAAGVSTRLGRRDMALLNSDWFSVTIDSYHDHRTAFRFQMNPAGVQRDATVTMDEGGENEDGSWDAVWEVETSTSADGWIAEVRIPFSQLRFRPEGAMTWGIQLERRIGRRGEIAHFSFVPKRELTGVPRYGHLMGLQEIGAGARAELSPYIAARGEYVDPGENPFRTDHERHVTAGADLLYRLSPNFTLNATINPDFGQVEVDPAVINLGVYETFFPERRPFFVEGSQIFNFTGNTSGGNLFYSRRVGRRPQLSPGTERADIPEASTILGAAKVTGRTGNGWSLGLLDAVTGRETIRYLDASDARQTFVAEPQTNYFIARAKRDMAEGRTTIGGVLTSVARQLTTPAAEAALRSSAVTAGVDFRHELPDQSWALSGTAAMTRVAGSEASLIALQRQSHHYFQRLDATHLGVDTVTSMSGYSAGFNLAKQAGEHWTGSVAAAITAPEFEANDLGFATRTDRKDVQGVVQYEENQPGRFLRNWNATAVYRHEMNFANDRIQAFGELGLEARHLSYWEADVGLTLRQRALDDRSTRGGPIIIRPGSVELGVGFQSDPRKPITASLDVSVADGEFGGDEFGLEGSVAIRASPRWSLSVGPSFTRGRVAAQYRGTFTDAAATTTFGRRYLFAPLEFTELQANIRANITFAPRITLEMFVQPLIYSSDYLPAGALTAPRTFTFASWSGAPTDEGDNTERSLRGNAVLRWEWRPGSAIYVAWQQTRESFGPESDFRFGRDQRLLFEAPPDNILVVKATYWLSM